MENDDIIEIEPESDEKSDDALLEEFDRSSSGRVDDVIAMQAVICILTAIILFGANLMYPETVGLLFSKLNDHISDSSKIIPNPIDLIITYFEQL